MTAELSQLFRTKREGVGFVLDAMQQAFPGDPIKVYTVSGAFIEPDEARLEALGHVVEDAGNVSVAIAEQKAEITSELFLQLRNKAISAYQEIMRMQM